ncbi:DUF6498-containing protein [Lysobacter tyrosinilyticus]
MTATPIRNDRATLGIVASNLLTLVTAWWQDWPLALMLWPYWCQSLVIGWFARKRILALHTFSTEGFKINDQAVEPTPQTQRVTANFFALHYGLFHFVYLIFLLTMSSVSGEPASAGGVMHRSDVLLILGLALSFWFSHRASYREHVAADLRRVPNIGTLMFLPYLRVLPMHLTIILGMALGDDWGRLLFGSLKTVADVAMHKIEHRWLQRAEAGGKSLPNVVE